MRKNTGVRITPARRGSIPAEVFSIDTKYAPNRITAGCATKEMLKSPNAMESPADNAA